MTENRLVNRSLLLAVLLSWFWPTSNYGQVSASLKGSVSDISGGVLPSATVTVKNVETGALRSSVSDEAGRYLVLALPVGEYEARAAKQGFQDSIRSGIYLVVG